MDVDPKVLEAVALLRQAGRMVLLKEGALEPGHLVRRASAGVAATDTACSPPRVAEKVSGVSRGVGARGGPGARKGRAARPERRPAAPRASPEAGLVLRGLAGGRLGGQGEAAAGVAASGEPHWDNRSARGERCRWKEKPRESRRASRARCRARKEEAENSGP
ncbi:hypothetical protein NDU88_002497 [Pleurodeles waltl]|uniref:Uncharacterized protein n=1 Tax=Pleurodeles waltl TaxID=8319 RepID=A0AAV7M144_PLEWA|nr:hypothetical protein NDU88_002497 [Pleurodeles waltl]